ncbi:DUF4214 domain-containing protein, partial [Duganella ginsengisoli]|nr:DUF4214 domain-containing protein [Pseudoduganella ginsengisoli]
NVLTLDNTGVADANGNAGSGTTASSNYTIDSTRPTATISLSDSALTAGETATVTITFSEAVTGLTTADLTVANGSIASLSSSDGGTTWTGTYTPSSSVDDATNVITLDNTGVQDSAGNAGSGSTSSSNYTVATVRPTATVALSDSALTAGETATVTITFSEAVTGLTTADLTVANGSIASLSSSDGGTTWTGTYTPTSSIEDTTNVITLDKTGVADSDGNTGSGTASSSNYTIDTLRPTATIGLSDTALKAGETATVTIAFSEAVTGLTTADLTVENGTVSSLSSSDGGATWTGTYTPTASIEDATNTITVDKTGVTDAAGNAGSGTTSSSNYTVDTLAPNAPSTPDLSSSSDSGTSSTDNVTNSTAPTLTGTAESGSTVTLYDTDGVTVLGTGTATGGNWSITSTTLGTGTHTITAKATDASGNTGVASPGLAVTVDTTGPTLAITSDKAALKAGETATITFTFSEDPGSTFTWDGSTGDMTVSGGTLGAISGSGTTRTATFTPAASTNGGTAGISVANSTYTDAAGNQGGAATTPALTFDTLAPTAPSTPDLDAGSDLGTSSTDNLTASLTPVLTGVAEAGSTVTLYDTDGTTVLGTGVATGGNWSITSSALGAGAHTVTAKATDAAGNTGSASPGLTVNIDATAPTVTITSDKSALKIGETAVITFTFSEDPGATFTWNGSSGDVTVSGGALGAISGSGLTRTATFTPTASTNGGTASITVTASAYTDAAGNQGGAGVTPSLAFDTLAPVAPSVPALSASADSGSVGDGLTNAGVLLFTGTAEAGATVTLYDTNGTTVLGSGVATGGNWSITTTGTLPEGSHTVTARATDAAGNTGVASAGVQVIIDRTAPGAPTVSLEQDTGAQDGVTSNGQVNVGNLESGATWEYSTDGGTSWSGGSGSSLALTGNGAKAVLVRQTDAAGNISGSASLDFTLDTAVVNGASIALSDTALKIGETANVTISFTAPVSGFDSSDLQVANGAVSGLSSADGGKTWSGVFTPNANVTSAVNSIKLNLANVTTIAGTQGSGAASSSAFAIDTAAPVSTVSVADSTLGSGAVTAVTIAFSEAVTGLGLEDITVGNGALSNLSTNDGGKTWTATLTPATGVNVSGNVVTVENSGVQDLAGNAGKGSATSNAYTVNTPGIGASVTVSDGDLQAGETAKVIVTFNQKVGGDVPAAVAAKNGTLDGWSVSADGLTWTAALTPADNVTALQNVVSLNLQALTDGSGKPGQGTVLSGNYAVHTVRPHASVSVLSDTLLKGESSEVQIVFSEPVTGFGIEDLKVPNASLSSLSSNDGGKTWAAKLIPQENFSAPLNVIELDLSGVRNVAGNGGNAGLGTVQSNVYAIATLDGVRSTVDGVATITQSTPNSSGGKTVVVPVITTSRPEDPASEHSTLADIPLGLTNGAGGNSLLVSLPTGTGMQSEGPATPLSGNQALVDLIMRIESKTETGSGTQDEMKGLGTDFLGELGNTPLETKTLVPTAAASATSTGTIIISGNPANPIGVVIDTSHLPSNSTLQLDNVDFAAVVGNVTLRGGEGRNIVIGDDATQNIYLGPEDDVLAGGGGNDFVGSAGGNDRIDGGSGDDVVAGGVGNDTLSGGTGADMVQGGRSDIGNWMLTLTADGALAATHTNAIFATGGMETLQRSDFNAQGENLGFLAASTDYLIGVSLLYQAAFGRAPELAGLSYWSQQGMLLSDLAKGILRGAEWLSDKANGLTDEAFVQTVYRHALGRDAETAGLQYWLGVLGGMDGKPGASRAEVLQNIALSDEHRKAAAGVAGYTIAEDRTTREMGWLAGSGDDVLDGGAGSDVLVGGDGTDTVLYGGKLADYRFVLGKDGHVMVADKANTDVDILSSIEKGTFKDGTVDLTFLQSKSSELASLGLLYQTVLDRSGDFGGFAWWAGQHRDTASLVAGFLGAEEVKARYDGLTDTAVVQALYANTGLAQTAAGGVQSWISYAATHTKAELVGAWIANSDVQAVQFGAQGLWIV